MTDGIIQEVIDNYMINHNISPSLLNGLKQELIEKIKQKWKVINNTHAMCSCNADIEILKMLIGDNQE